ncbi:hypothetical protein [Limnoglobus roseus]|uniref:Uncharacterized protein n=1 Tax=Limnoglobus roseus TaxID=2598579 RepID=A0A5C1AM20_9BACT|nr:hypothetical protein [Limnoglobus roseus]QEL19237.1 hypothetical protein PX52LOC_06299 [Limnoglobus roseus]
MARPDFIAYACVSREAGLAARVRWLPTARLTPEVVQIAERMGFFPEEIARVGVLTADLPADGVVFLREAVVIPDEDGVPCGFFGWDSPGAVDRLTQLLA